MNLYEIDIATQRVFNQIDENGEITPEIEAELIALQEDALSAILNTKNYLEKTEDNIMLAKAKAHKFMTMAKEAQQRVDNVKSWIINWMDTHKVNLIEADTKRIRLVSGKEKVIIDDETEIPDTVMKYNVTMTPEQYELLAFACKLKDYPVPDFNTDISKAKILEIHKNTGMETNGTHIEKTKYLKMS